MALYPTSYTFDASELAAVEQALNLRLPDFVWSFYEKQAELISELRLVSNDEPYIYLSTNFDWIVAQNRDFLHLPRASGPCRNKICLGSDGCGNDMFVHLTGTDETVYQLDHEIAWELFDEAADDFRWDDPQMNRWPSLIEYCRFCIEIYRS